jgi:hypothetical protein
MTYNGDSDPLGVAGFGRVLEVAGQTQILARLATAVDVPLPCSNLVGPGPYIISESFKLEAMGRRIHLSKSSTVAEESKMPLHSTDPASDEAGKARREMNDLMVGKMQ